jgi:hypothetical protein
VDVLGLEVATGGVEVEVEAEVEAEAEAEAEAEVEMGVELACWERCVESARAKNKGAPVDNIKALNSDIINGKTPYLRRSPEEERDGMEEGRGLESSRVGGCRTCGRSRFPGLAGPDDTCRYMSSQF